MMLRVPESMYWKGHSSCSWVWESLWLAHRHMWPQSPRDFSLLTFLFLKQDFFFYLFLEREQRKKEREGNINVWLPLMHPPPGTWLAPRHVPWLGIKPATLWCAGQSSIHWATPAKATAHISLARTSQVVPPYYKVKGKENQIMVSISSIFYTSFLMPFLWGRVGGTKYSFSSIDYGTEAQRSKLINAT